MSVEYSVVSIGALSRNRLWGESAAVRTSHATTTAVFDEGKIILVDPSLPVQALGPVFNERTGKQLADVTDVFCTTLRPVHRRSILALPEANWWAHKDEIDAHRAKLAALLDSAERMDPTDAGQIEADLKLLESFRPAPEKFTEQVTVYPMAGATAGSAGLLLTPPTMSVVIAGDAVLTAGHVALGRVWEGCENLEQAVETLRDVLEFADVIVPGHDNVCISPGRWV
jgi:glyoxylase-like metal-dependent hydrolase (beta-lactamase superfamily II)